MILPAVIAHCPALGRDIAALQAAVPGVRVFEGARLPPGEDGAVFSHHAIVQLAQVNNWPAVWVLEDDCALTPAFDLAQWGADVDWMIRNRYDVLTGGVIRTARAQWVTDRLMACDRFKSAHCVVYARSAYETVLLAGPPLDLQLGRLGLRCLVAVPFVAVQAPSYSGLLNRAVDYGPMYTRHEAALLAVPRLAVVGGAA